MLTTLPRSGSAQNCCWYFVLLLECIVVVYHSIGSTQAHIPAPTVKMLPRAGRRASAVPPMTSAIDPLEGPPQPVAVQSSAAPPSSTEAPNWLTDGPDAEPLYDGPRDRSGAVSPQSKIPRVGMSPAHLPTSAPTWLEEVPSRAVTPQPLPPAASSESVPPVAPLQVPALSVRAAETPMMSARRDADMESNKKLPVAVSLPMAQPLSTSVHPAPPVVPYEDHRAVLLLLEKETEDVNAAIATKTAAIAALENGSHPDCEGIIAASTQLEYVHKQLDSAATTAKMVSDGFAERRAALEARRALRVAALAAEIQEEVTTSLNAKCGELDVLVRSIEGTVADLRQNVSESINGIVNDSCGGSGEAHAVHHLGQKLIVLLREERSGLKMVARNVLQDEVRVVVSDTAMERSAMLEQDRAGRARMVREHGEARQRNFNAFRVRAKEERQTSSDRVFGELKLRMAAFAKEGAQKSVNALKAHRERMQQEDDRVHRDAYEQVDKMLARQHGEVVDFEKACERSAAELQQRLTMLAVHEQRMHDTNEQSAQRLFLETVRQVGHGTVDPLGQLSSLSSQDGLSVNRHATDAVAASVKALHRDIEVALLAVSTATDRATSSEVARLVQERETVLKELRRHMDERKDRLSQEWLRLESMLTGLGCKAEAFEKSVRQGRATLTAAQARLDQVRAAWESSGLKCLQSAFVSASPLAGETLPLSSEALLNSILFDVSCKLRDVIKLSKKHSMQRGGFATTLTTNEQVLAEQRQRVAKATHDIFTRFEQLADVSAKVEMKESVLRSEENDCAVATQQLRKEETAFQAAVVVAKQVAERLQAASADAQHRRDDVAVRGRWWPHALGGALQPTRRRDEGYSQRSQYPTARGSDASLSESKYRHLYEDYRHPQQQHRSKHNADALGDPSYAVSGGDGGGHSLTAAHFQSLVPLDSMDSMGVYGASGNRTGAQDHSSRSRRTDASYGHIEGRAYQQHHEDASSSSLSGRADVRAGSGAEQLLLGGVAPATRLSSDSASADMARRRSLPTPSTDSGLPL